MHVPTLIERKRDGGRLSADEVRFLVEGFTEGTIPDSQVGALAMAIFFQGMDDEETAALTASMLESGTSLNWGDDSPLRVDKHSTGGVGDKTSLVLAPLLACDGLWVPMISGRALGITGGTLDKLESIPGFRTGLAEDEMRAVLEDTGCVMVGQTEAICPADRKLYALRDVTGTVPSIPLITASIMSKKLAEGLNRLVLDVKHGSGAFMKWRRDAEDLGSRMQQAGEALGVKTRVVLTPMDEPLGNAAGNALEVAECIACLQGQGPTDLEALTLDLAAEISESSRTQLETWLHDGTAWARFQRMVSAQGGQVEALERLTEIHAAPYVADLEAPRSGVVEEMNAGVVGRVCQVLGAGRSRVEDSVDFAVGCDRIVKTGGSVRVGDPLLRVHARTQAALDEALGELASAVVIE